FSSDGRILVSASFDNTLRRWDLAAGERAKWRIPVGGIVDAVNFSPDSKRLVSGSQITIRSAAGESRRLCVTQLWDVDERIGLIPRAAFTNETEDLTCQVRFSPDGTIVGTDDFVRLRFLRVPGLTPIFAGGARTPRWEDLGRWLVYVDQPFRPRIVRC